MAASAVPAEAQRSARARMTAEGGEVVKVVLVVAGSSVDGVKSH